MAPSKRGYGGSLLSRQGKSKEMMREATLIEKVWMAAFVDGEGTIRISKLVNAGRPSYCGFIGVTNTDSRSFNYFTTLYGGHIFKSVQPGVRHKIRLNWYCPHYQHKQLLQDISPYLLLKQRQAEILALFYTGWKALYGHYSTNEYKDIETTRRRLLYEEMLELNARGT